MRWVGRREEIDEPWRQCPPALSSYPPPIHPPAPTHLLQQRDDVLHVLNLHVRHQHLEREGRGREEVAHS